MLEPVRIGNRWLRRGFTTGTCAAAAAKAAVLACWFGEVPETVTLETPDGVSLTLPVVSRTDGDIRYCGIVKDGGDDPDVTTGLVIEAAAERLTGSGIRLETGEGIGRVTRQGLAVPVGEPAINPVPMAMILDAVNAVLPPNAGVRIRLQVPGGEERAKKTFNPELGIVGGISILGTTGLVEPMSVSALEESIALGIHMVKAAGFDRVILVPGAMGRSFAVSTLGLPEDRIVIMSNLVGAALDASRDEGFREILIVGELGKIVKLAGGIFQTHNRVADARMEILAAHAGRAGASPGVIEQILASATTAGAAQVINENGLETVWKSLTEAAAGRAAARAETRVGVAVYGRGAGLMAVDQTAGAWLKEPLK